jgi:transaldolase
MYAYLKKYGYDTICMPASFRSSTGGGGTNGANGVSMDPVAELDQVLALVGVDQMTLPVRLLEILSTTNVPVTMQVDAKEEAAVCCDPDFTLTKETWDLYIPSDPCVMDKFEEGLRMFKSDTEKIRSIFMDQW